MIYENFRNPFYYLWKWEAKLLVIPFLLITPLIVSTHTVYAQFLDRPPEIDEVNYSPEEGDVTGTNPPAFIWLPAEGADSYIVQYSRDHTFSPDQTFTVRDIDMTVYVPAETIDPGTWFWRFGFNDGHSDHFSKTREFIVPESAVAFPYVAADVLIENIPKERPRLFFTPAQVREIRTDTSGKYDFLNKESVIMAAEEILAMEEPLFEEPGPWYYGEQWPQYRPLYYEAWRTMRPYTRRMVTSAMAYIYTGDERYAAEARRRLMHFMSWDVDGASSATWPSELGMDIAENATPVFDWIYDTLDEEEKRICIEVLTARMEQINRDVHRARPMESRPYINHPNRMIGFVIEGGIALAHESPEAGEWLDYTLKLLWSSYPTWGGDDGGWHAGVSYWSSYVQRISRVVLELNRYGFPLKNKPFFQNTGYFGLYVGYPNRPTSAFGDGQINPVGSRAGELMYALSTLYQNPYFRWHSETFGIEHLSSRASLLYVDSDLQSKPPEDLPQSRVFYDVGITAMHSNMAEPDSNVMMLFRSDPFGVRSHNHASQNAFVIEAYGEPLAISSGARQQHGSPSHREWMWQTKAHNSILVDGKGQIRGREAGSKIIAYEENGDYVYTAGDATAAYDGRLDRFHRHILFIRPGYFIIIDDLKTADEASTFQWLLHGPTEMQVDQINNTFVGRSGNARLTTRFMTPQKLEYRQHTGFTPEMVDPSRMWNQFHLTVSTIQKKQLQRFVTVMSVDQTSGTPAVKPDSPSTSRRELAIRGIDKQDNLDDVILQAELLDAEGGVALRLGNDLILWREKGQKCVVAVGVTSINDMEVKKNFFK